MVLRQLGIEGKLPSYSDARRLGQRGSAARSRTSSARPTSSGSRSGRARPRCRGSGRSSLRFAAASFESSFRSIFGDSPETLYDRFRAELTARPHRRGEASEGGGPRRGELSLRLRGGTLAPPRSRPTGRGSSRGATPSRHESELAMLGARRRRRRETARVRSEASLDASAGRRLCRLGSAMDAGRPRDALRPPRARDADGTLRVTSTAGSSDRAASSRVSRGADVGDADPAPGGDWAVAVRGRFGTTALVRVELPSGAGRDPGLAAARRRRGPSGAIRAFLPTENGSPSFFTPDAAGGSSRCRPRAGRPARLRSIERRRGLRRGAPTARACSSRAAAAGIWNLVDGGPFRGRRREGSDACHGRSLRSGAFARRPGSLLSRLRRAGRLGPAADAR